MRRREADVKGPVFRGGKEEFPQDWRCPCETGASLREPSFYEKNSLAQRMGFGERENCKNFGFLAGSTGGLTQLAR
jgi:hypothetical protein